MNERNKLLSPDDRRRITQKYAQQGRVVEVKGDGRLKTVGTSPLMTKVASQVTPASTLGRVGQALESIISGVTDARRFIPRLDKLIAMLNAPTAAGTVREVMNSGATSVSGVVVEKPKVTAFEGGVDGESGTVDINGLGIRMRGGGYIRGVVVDMGSESIDHVS